MDKWILLLSLVLSITVAFCLKRLFRWGHYRFIRFKRSISFRKKLRHYKYWLPAAIGGLISLPVLTYILNFQGQPLSVNAEHWGQVGDFFGGMLNPLLAFASFIALLYTIRIQSEELRLTREEFQKSVQAQQDSVGNQLKQLKLSKSLEEFNAINSLYLRFLEETESQYKLRVRHEHSIQQAIFKLLSTREFNDPEQLNGCEGVENKATMSELSIELYSNFILQSTEKRRAKEVALNCKHTYNQYLKLYLISNRLHDDEKFEFLLDSYAEQLAKYLMYSGLINPLNKYAMPENIECPLLKARLINEYRSYSIAIPAALLDTQPV